MSRVRVNCIGESKRGPCLAVSTDPFYIEDDSIVVAPLSTSLIVLRRDISNQHYETSSPGTVLRHSSARAYRMR